MDVTKTSTSCSQDDDDDMYTKQYNVHFFLYQKQRKIFKVLSVLFSCFEMVWIFFLKISSMQQKKSVEKKPQNFNRRMIISYCIEEKKNNYSGERAVVCDVY